MELPSTAQSTSAGMGVVDAATAERRRYRRFDVDIAGYAVGVPRPEVGDHYWETMQADSDSITIKNLSGAGLYFTTRAYFEVADQVWIAMSLGGEMQPVRAIVIHREEFKDESEGEYFGMGVQFVKTEFAAPAVAAIFRYLNSIAPKPAPIETGSTDKKKRFSVFNGFKKKM